MPQEPPDPWPGHQHWECTSEDCPERGSGFLEDYRPKVQAHANRTGHVVRYERTLSERLWPEGKAPTIEDMRNRDRGETS
jgi:hypothetical protein